jgi:uncharacterized protein YgbK (DUF1537 family)
MNTHHIFLGCIADDFTGATDLANNLVRAGMRVQQIIGVPDRPLEASVDAVVIALKSRTNPASEAIEQSLDALRWLESHGARQIYFKYCSTFDSTAAGNIGPVIDALMEAMGETFTVATPAFPENGRTVFNGHLFVGQQLLSDSSMRSHPLTPMTDANLVRVLQAQSAQLVGLIDHTVIAEGEEAIRQAVAKQRESGIGIAIVDAISNDELMTLGRAVGALRLVTAGSGVAIGLPQNFGFNPSKNAGQLPSKSGLRAIVSGSCSAATNRQVADYLNSGGAGIPVDALRVAQGHDVVSEVLEWARPRINKESVLAYATASTETVRAVQQVLGVDQAGALVESTLASIAKGFVELGVRQLLVAGGETSGACIQELRVREMRIGPQIDPGVPWCFARGKATDGTEMELHVALKSGNFGTDDFFTKAFEVLS